MSKYTRMAAIAGSAILLLAAGKAPEVDLSFLQSIPESPNVVEPHLVPAIVEDSTEMAEPALGPVLPDAETLPRLVDTLRTDGQLDEGDFNRGAELHCLATAVYFESKGEPLDGQLAVAQVILNRVEKGRFGDNVCAVVKAPRQFGFVRSGQLPEATHAAQWETARAIAWIALSDGWREIVPNATHFHATRVNPGWNLRRIATVGRHVFYH